MRSYFADFDNSRRRQLSGRLILSFSAAILALSASVGYGQNFSGLADGVRMHFATPASLSIRDQYIYTSVFQTAFNRWSNRSNVSPCGLTLRLDDQFSTFYLAAKPANLARHGECLRHAISYVLDDTIGEADFLAARAARADDVRRWTAPHPRHESLANRAASRLAYLAIYKKDSPLHQLYSVNQEDVIGLSLDAFRLWLRSSREEKLVMFDARPSLIEALGLPAKDAAPMATPISLSSPRTPPGILFFDGERFRVPGLIMMSLDPEYVARRLADNNVWKRFSCNRVRHPDSNDNNATGAIAGITCTVNSVFGSDSWLALAVRKSNEAEYRAFCEQMVEFASDDDIVSLTRSTPEQSRGLYVVLSNECEEKK
jgi:hypothetical protein